MTRNRVLLLFGVFLSLLATVSILFAPAPTMVAGAPLRAAQERSEPEAPNPLAQPSPSPGPPVSMTPAFASALQQWTPPDASKVGNSNNGKRETWYEECTSGKVNVSATQGWCYVSVLHLFFNFKNLWLLDATTGRVFGLIISGGKPALGEIVSAETDEGVRPPFLSLKGSTPGPLSLQCTSAQKAAAQQHVAGLQANANKTDSPAMAKLFKDEATWWSNFCG